MRRRRPIRGLGCLLVLAALFGCMGVSVFTLDRICYSVLSQRVPIYLNARIAVRQHNFLSEWGMGDTSMVLYSDDPPEEVRAWYAVTTGAYLRRALQNNEPFFRMAQGDWAVETAEDGVSSQILLYGTCVN
ncbi:MAG: hypothetical protein HC828_07575 [Blastochloris sp.]|nr:hypothetical protein [Blastochloris sp.]